MQPDWQHFLAGQGARIADDSVAHFGDPAAELTAARDGTVLCDLSHLGLIVASGDDALAFLQGQFTNDVEKLPDDAVQYNGWCSAKGRLLATFLLWKGRQGYLLQLPAALVAPVMRRLAMFVLRSKVALADTSADWVRLGIAGRNAAALLREVCADNLPGPMASWHGDGMRVICLDVARFEIVAAPDKAQALWQTFAPHCTRSGAAVWSWLDIRAGIPTVLPATQDQFVPQMANFELVGGVSFKKGCYPGQEIVARTQYRGILKRRMGLAHLDIAARPGDKVYSAAFGEQAAGEIANAAPAPGGGFDVLVVAQLDSMTDADHDPLRIGAPDGPPLTVAALPYGIPPR